MGTKKAPPIEKPTLAQAELVPGVREYLATEPETRRNYSGPKGRRVAWDIVGPYLWLWWKRGGKAAEEIDSLLRERDDLRATLDAIDRARAQPPPGQAAVGKRRGAQARPHRGAAGW